MYEKLLKYQFFDRCFFPLNYLGCIFHKISIKKWSIRYGLSFIFILTHSVLNSINVANWSDLNTAIGTANVAFTSTTINFTCDVTQATNFLTPLCINSPGLSFSLLNNCAITVSGANHGIS